MTGRTDDGSNKDSSPDENRKGADIYSKMPLNLKLLFAVLIFTSISAAVSSWMTFEQQMKSNWHLKNSKDSLFRLKSSDEARRWELKFAFEQANWESDRIEREKTMRFELLANAFLEDNGVVKVRGHQLGSRSGFEVEGQYFSVDRVEVVMTKHWLEDKEIRAHLSSLLECDEKYITIERASSAKMLENVVE